MDLRATKDTYEREEDEAERLVRPAPKVKPPRHDKRREHVHVDPDDDTATSKDTSQDEDRSLNYKTIGGSMAQRVARRFAEDTVVVKNKENETVWVRPKTLQEEPGEYKKVSPTEPEPEEGKPRQPAQARRPDRPQRHKDPLPHPKWPDQRPLPKRPIKLPRPPHPVKRVPPFPMPKEEHPVVKPPGWVPMPRTPSGRYASIPDRVLARYLEAKAAPSSLKKVKHKETGRTVRITDDTLKKHPESYEEVTEEQEESGFQDQREQLEELSQESPPLKKLLDELKKKGPAYQEIMDMPDAGMGYYSWWHDLQSKGKWPEGVDRLGDLIGIAEAKPKGKPSLRRPSVQDESGAYSTPQPIKKDEAPSEKKAPAKTVFQAPSKPEPKPEETAKTQPSPEAPAAKDPKAPPEVKDVEAPSKEAPAKAEPPKRPPGKDTLKSEEAPPEELKKEPAEPKSKKAPPAEGEPAEAAKPAGPEKPKTPWGQASPAEQRSVTNRIRALGIPKATVEKLLATGLHPRELHPVIDTYQVAIERPAPKDPKKFIDTLGDKYETDPNKVKPPKEGLSLNPFLEKVVMPFDQLTPEEQETAMSAHRAKVIGLSVAAHDLATQTLQKQTGASPEFAGKLADAMFRKTDKADWEQTARDDDEARRIYQTSMGKGHPVNVKKLLNSVAGNPAAEKMAVAYCQAQDYAEARKRFLDPKSPEAFSEQDTPVKILSAIGRAQQFLRDREKEYPANSVVDSTATHFRERITKLLKNLSPSKYDAIQDHLQEMAAADYEVAASTHAVEVAKAQEAAVEKYWTDYDKRKQAIKEWEKARKQEVKDWEKQQAKGQKGKEPKPKTQVGGPYRVEPPSSKIPAPPPLPSVAEAKAETEALLRDIALKMPKPREPEGYIPTTPAEKKKRRKDVDTEWSYWDKAAFSTCTPGCAMDKSSHERQAVYWGVPVDREGITPYPDWTQVHQRDMGDRDYNGILRSAKDWLKTPVLAVSVEGIERDTQVRAALDLAIRTHEAGRYSVGVHPAIYNYLLAKLAGESQDETLLTVREASDGSVYAPTGESAAMKPSAQVRAFAAKIAATHPEIAFDLASLSAKIANDEQQDDDKKDDKKEEGKAFPGAAPPFGKKEEKKAAEDEPKQAEDEPKEEQKKEAYVALRSACIRTAASNPQARAALTPVLQLIKQLG